MIKVYALLPKRADISEAQFHEHWATVHRDHALKIARLRRYVQAHRTGESVPGFALAPYDGIPEVWYDSLESAVGQDDDPAYIEGAQRDEPSFIEMDGIAWVMTDERLVRDALDLDATPEATKVILLVRRPEGADPAAFAGGWSGACAAALGVLPEVARAAVATTLPETYGQDEPAYDGVLELWWPDPSAFAREWEQAGQRALEELGVIAALERSHGAVYRELRVIWPGPGREPVPNQQEAA